MKGKILLLIGILVVGQIAAADSWSTFESKEYRIVFQYPTDWVRDTENEKDFGDWDRIVAFKADVPGEGYYARMDVSLLEGVAVSDIQVFLDGFEQGIKDALHDSGGSATFLSKNSVRGLNFNGYKLEFRINIRNIVIREIFVFFFRKNGTYVIGFSCDEKEFSKYDKIQRKMTSSFEFYKEQAEIDTIFQTAKNNFDGEKWDMALKYFEEAKFHYARIDSTQLVKTCEEWITKTQKVIDAQELVKNAEALFGETKYEESRELYKKVRDIYIETGMARFVQGIEEKITQVDAKIEEVRKEMERKKIEEEADSLVSEAKSLFDSKKYDEAKAKFEEARVKFESIQDNERIKECDEWIKKSEEAGVTIIPVLIALLIVLFILKRKH
jgi:hypothetical protein